MKKNLIVTAMLLLASALLSGQEARGGADEFVQYLQENREALRYDAVERTEQGDKVLVIVRGPLSTQQALLDVLDRFAFLEFGFTLDGPERVVISAVFQGAGPAQAAAPQAQAETTAPVVAPPAAAVASPLAPAKKSKFTAGVSFLYYYVLNKNIDGLYGRMIGPSLDLAFRFAPKADVWLSAAYASRSAQPDWSGEDFKLTLIPLSGGFRYHVMEKGKWDVFLGAGAGYFLVKEINPVADIDTGALGFWGMGGAYYKLSRRLAAQAALRYNLVSKDVYPELEVDDMLDLGGMELRLGLALSF